MGGRIETAGFGALDQSLAERRIDDFTQYNVATTIEWGKFFPEKAKVSIPMYYAYSKDQTKAKYNPLDQDIKLSDALDAVDTKAEKAIPVELGTEGHFRFVAGVFQVAQLHFVIVTHHGCLETDVRRQVVQAELLDVTGVTVVLLQLLERAERFRIRCVVVGEVTAVILGRFIFRFRILRFRLAE